MVRTLYSWILSLDCDEIRRRASMKRTQKTDVRTLGKASVETKGPVGFNGDAQLARDPAGLSRD